MKLKSKELNKTQLQKITEAKTWFKKSDKFALDFALKNFKIIIELAKQLIKMKYGTYQELIICK